MSNESSLQLASYESLSEALVPLQLPVSISEVHGLLCGYLCAGAIEQGESYIRALMHHKKAAGSRDALLALFSVYAISQQQINNYDVSFNLLLPDDECSLRLRAQAFSDWCEGFMQGLITAGIEMGHFHDEDAQEALEHISEFANLDCDSLAMDNDDERALVEVTEFTRMAVIRLHTDLMIAREQDNTGTAH